MYGLQFSDIYARIKDYANIKGVTDADTKSKKAANDALRLISTLRNWEILKRESTITPIASQQAYALAANFDHIISCWFVSNGEEIPVDVVDDDRWQRENNESNAGTPQICRITKVSGTQKIEFAPIPDGNFISQYTEINYDYVKKVTELSADADVPEVPDTAQQMAIVYLAVSDLLAKQGDINGMAVWEAKATRLLNAAHKVDDKKQGRTSRMGKPMIPINALRSARIADYQ